MKEEREKRQLEAKRKRIYQQKMAEREAKLAERERLAQEKARRAEERQARIKAQEEFQRKRDLAAKMNLNMNDQQLKELTGEELLKQRQQEEIEKHRKLQKKMRAQSNHVDYFAAPSERMSAVSLTNTSRRRWTWRRNVSAPTKRKPARST